MPWKDDLALVGENMGLDFEGLHHRPEAQGDLFNDLVKDLEFPWVNIEAKRPIQRKRNLDFPLLEWEPMEELIKEDLKLMLGEFEELETQRLVSMTWNVTLDHLRVFPCHLEFRHPHALVEDARFKTFLSRPIIVIRIWSMLLKSNQKS